MKCKYTFPLRGRLIRFPVSGFSFDFSGRTYEFREARPYEFELSLTVPNFPDTSLPKMIKNEHGNAKFTITAPEDPFWDDLLADIRTIEGGLCLWGIDEINVDECKTEYIPENEHEKEKIQIFSHSKKPDDSPPKDLPYSPLDMFVRTVLALSDLKASEVPMNFYRRGRQDVYYERYVEAIYDLYFFLEFLFAVGKFKKDDVKEKFLKSNDLVEAIMKIKGTPDPLIALNPFHLKEYQEKYRNKSVEEIIKHIVQLRGYLHHYNPKRKDMWHPARQRDYKVDALTILQICHEIISSKTNTILFRSESMRVFLEAEVKTEDGRKFQWNPKGAETFNKAQQR